MARLSKLSPGVSMPGSVASKFSASRRGGDRSTPGICVMYQDRNNYVVFKLKQNSLAGGFAGNLWKVLLYRSATNRFSFRLVNPDGTILKTITKSDGAASLMAAVNADTTVNPYVTMRIIGTIGSTTDFASSITDYCRFTGGS